MKTLLIINPQNDFYNEDGPRYNLDNEYVVDKIVELIENDTEINEIILALTSHPSLHKMFGSADGGVEKYCVTDSDGEKIIPKIEKIFKKKSKSRNIKCKKYVRGTLIDYDEYSAAPYAENIDGKVILKSATDFASVNNNGLIICGFDGDVEIIKTLEDLSHVHNVEIELFMNGIASTNDNLLVTYVENHNIKTYER